MIRHSLALAKAQEFAQRQAVRATPFQPTLAVDALQSSRSAAYGSSVPVAAMDGRGAVHSPRHTEPPRTDRNLPRSKPLAACRKRRGLESVASQPTTPACPPGVPAAVQEPSATSRPRQAANESNQG